MNDTFKPHVSEYNDALSWLVMSRRPGIELTAIVVAFVIAACELLWGLTHILGIFAAIIPFAAAVGIMRRRIWSAYGFALFQFAGCLTVLITKFWLNAPLTPDIWYATALSFAMSVLFFFTGRTLANRGCKRGFALPWIALAALETVPFIFLQAFVLPTGSMEDTLLIGDHFLMRVFPKVHPVNGDIVVFHFPIDRSQIYSGLSAHPAITFGLLPRPSIETDRK